MDRADKRSNVAHRRRLSRNSPFVGRVVSDDGSTGGSGTARVGFLAGDVNGSRSVTLSNLLSVNAVLTQLITAANFLRDVNGSGTLTLSDNLFVDGRLTQVLPAP